MPDRLPPRSAPPAQQLASAIVEDYAPTLRYLIAHTLVLSLPDTLQVRLLVDLMTNEEPTQGETKGPR